MTRADHTNNSYTPTAAQVEMVYAIFVTALLVAQAPPPAKNGADCGSGITCYPCLSPDETVEVDPRG